MSNRYRNYRPRYSPPQRMQKKHRRVNLKILLLAALFVFGGKFVVDSLFNNRDQNKTPAASSTPKPEKKILAEPITSTTWNDLNQRVTSLIDANAPLDISVSIIDVSSNTKANYGVQEAFHGASTTKVLTAAAYLHDVETGKRTLTENLGGGSAQTHLKRMINLSDNNSWAILNSAVGYTRLNSYARTNGINSFKYIGNVMTANDQALLLNKLYKRELLNDSHTKLLLSFMQNTNNESMIPRIIPGGTLYHKYGQLDDRLHDSAVLDFKDRPIVLVIYTKGTSDGNVYSARTALIQNIAKTVFDTVYQQEQKEE